MKNVSVLVSLYDKESANYFNLSLQSLYEQEYKPKEIILVLDGPINNELNSIITKWLTLLPITLVPLKENVGLAKALNEGLKYCHCDYIARMDTDDICTPERFLVQTNFLDNNPNIDVVGTWISEINEDNIEIRNAVKYPLIHSELFKFFSKRDPLAHPTVMFRKRFFEKAGNYPIDIPLGEDTALWFSGFKNNCKFANIPHVGLKFRRTSDFYLRRANKKKTISLLEYRIFKINKELRYGLSANIYAILYAFLALSPIFIKKVMYKYLR
ncbi:Extracellular polysaccharide glycosyltransferase (Cell wall biogenesis) [Xenorhabdus poinarii G6]|uniref:Extracellular polysaccharide glycosyltransferase (Cell wall biogenesis) n=1 Tax=Xenorhabdus poinarii G6 TaxID=1354304 RepID=A0A068R8N2_9GAMM|nr:glycosyltransferase [Xenorhabdus poinarii]CDG23241.1 Extracellular polysaccharide glycosyltransferase (Cell wall biogenesis) [Xenorhabdus poinarii G6]